MIPDALRLPVCLGAVVLAASPALAQFGGTPIVPSEGFRSAPQAAAPARPRATAARSAPARALVAAGPIYDEGTYARAAAALQVYTDIAARGGWPTLPKGAKLGPGANSPDVAVLRQRLAVTGDLDPGLQGGTAFDDAVVAALKRFQARHGLSETGSVGPLTLEALNVPAETRVHQLTASMER